MNKFWLKNEFGNEFCPIKCFGKKGSIFYPEITKSELSKNNILVGEYWFSGNCWCFSLFLDYEHLSV
jgi:hypothetical protein